MHDVHALSLCSLQVQAAGGSSALFEQYCDPATDEIGPEGRKFLRTLHLMPINLCVLAVLLSLMLAVHAGVERFCSDINTDPSDRKVSSSAGLRSQHAVHAAVRQWHACHDRSSHRTWQDHSPSTHSQAGAHVHWNAIPVNPCYC